MPHLKSFIEQCEYCQIHMPSHPKEPLIPTEAPLYPFQMVAADYFEVGTWTNSGWNRITLFPLGTSAELIRDLGVDFAAMGVPEVISCN